MAKKKAARSKVSAKKTASRPKRTVKKRKAVATKTSRAKKKAAPRKTSARKKPVSLGRPRIAGDAELEQMFLKDYEARQVFQFLRVKTVKELEEYRPAEIVELLTAPMVQTVDRIRKALAVNNRHLSGDRKFALRFKRQLS